MTSLGTRRLGNRYIEAPTCKRNQDDGHDSEDNDLDSRKACWTFPALWWCPCQTYLETGECGGSECRTERGGNLPTVRQARIEVGHDRLSGSKHLGYSDTRIPLRCPVSRDSGRSIVC